MEIIRDITGSLIKDGDNYYYIWNEGNKKDIITEKQYKQGKRICLKYFVQ